MSSVSYAPKPLALRRPVGKPTLVLRIRGGIGNQLFQYAFGRKVALDCDANLRFDRSEYDQFFNRNYSLNLFHSKGLTATETDIAKTLWPASAYGSAVRLCRKIYPFYNRRYVREDDYKSLDATARYRRNTYLDGYWQDWRVPYSIADELREDIVLKKPMVLERLKILQQIESGPSAAIHVRYGDYGLAHNLQNFGLCSAGYYKGAMDYLQAQVPGLTFFVFSDTPERAREMVPGGPNVVFCDPLQDGADHEDLMVMAACDHIITANSTFSWWAAFLNGNPDRHIIAPMKWFNNPKLDDNILVPPGWMRL